ncbi:hypothetical protein STEG23_033633, partial [Scotinomys teguina]
MDVSCPVCWELNLDPLLECYSILRTFERCRHHGSQVTLKWTRVYFSYEHREAKFNEILIRGVQTKNYSRESLPTLLSSQIKQKVEGKCERGREDKIHFLELQERMESAITCKALLRNEGFQG